MIDENKRQKKPNWSSLISSVVLIALLAGRPLLNLLTGLLNGASISIPWTSFLPYVIGAGIFVVGLVVVVRVLGNAIQGPHVPTTPPTQRYEQGTVQTPGFEPVVPPVTLFVGVIGLVALGILALVVLL